MIGQTYAKNSIQLFISAISEINKESDFKVVLDLYGNQPSNLTESAVSTQNLVNYLGWVDPNEIVKVIEKYDFALLPYFEDDNKIVGEMSFPSKMIFYCKAKIPILYIGNKNSHGAKLIYEYNIGKILNQNEIIKKEFINDLRDLVGMKVNVEFKNNMNMINSREFSYKSFVASLRKIKKFKDIGFSKDFIEIGVSNTIKDIHELKSKVDFEPNSNRYSYYYSRLLIYLTHFSQSKRFVMGEQLTQLGCPIFHKNGQMVIPKYLLEYGGEPHSSGQLNVNSASKRNIEVFVKSEDTYYSSIIFGNPDVFDSKIFYENDLKKVVSIINPEKSNKVILIKKFNKKLPSKKNKKVVIKEFLDISDFFLLSLLGNFAYIFGKTKLTELLVEIAAKSKIHKIDLKEFMYILHDSIIQYHVHDPQIYKSFKIVVKNTYNLEELQEIYHSLVKLNKKSLGSKFDEVKCMKKFIGFLFILDLDYREIQNLLSGLLKIESPAFLTYLNEMKPMKYVKFIKLHRITKKIFSFFIADTNNIKSDNKAKEKGRLIYSL